MRRIQQGSPKFELSRQEALRRLLHFSIRQIVQQEDPFAVHLSAKACARMSADIANHRQMPMAGTDDLIKPEHRKEWRRINNETYNYLKHADRDPESSLGVHDLVGTNRLLTLLNCQNYSDLFTKSTAHSNMFYIYVAISEPDARKLMTLTDQVWEYLELNPEARSGS